LKRAQRAGSFAPARGASASSGGYGLGELVAAELGRRPGLNPIAPSDEIVPLEEAALAPSSCALLTENSRIDCPSPEVLRCPNR
jgi:hypothetical protein